MQSKFVSVFAALLLATPALAQDAPLTIDNAIAAAIANNPAIAAAEAGASAAEESVGIARSFYYPQVSADARFSRWQSHAFLPSRLGAQLGSSLIGPTNDWALGADVKYTAFDSGRRRSEVAAARAIATAAQSEHARVRADVVAAVEEAFFGVLGAQEEVEVAEARRARAEDHVRLAQLRKDAGAVPSIDVVRARTERANAEAGLLRARSMADVSRGALNMAMGRAAELPLELSAEKTLERHDGWSAEESLARAIALRPELAAARARAEAARQRVRAERSARGPRVGVQGGYGLRDDGFWPEDQEWSIGVGVEIDLFNGYATRHRVARARQEQIQQEALATQSELAVRQEVWAASAAMRETLGSAEAAATAEREASEAMRLARARYEAGAGTINDLLDAETALLSAQAARIRAAYRHQIAWSDLRRSAGETR